MIEMEPPHRIGVCPAIVEVMAGPNPWNGTCTTSRPRSIRNWRSPSRCGSEPNPGVAYEYLPGLARSNSNSSLMLLTGREPLTEIRPGAVATRVTGVKLPIGSYDVLVLSSGTVRKSGDVNRIVLPSAGATAA